MSPNGRMQLDFLLTSSNSPPLFTTLPSYSHPQHSQLTSPPLSATLSADSSQSTCVLRSSPSSTPPPLLSSTKPSCFPLSQIAVSPIDYLANAACQAAQNLVLEQQRRQQQHVLEVRKQSSSSLYSPSPCRSSSSSPIPLPPPPPIRTIDKCAMNDPKSSIYSNKCDDHHALVQTDCTSSTRLTQLDQPHYTPFSPVSSHSNLTAITPSSNNLNITSSNTHPLNYESPKSSHAPLPARTSDRTAQTTSSPTLSSVPSIPIPTPSTLPAPVSSSSSASVAPGTAGMSATGPPATSAPLDGGVVTTGELNCLTMSRTHVCTRCGQSFSLKVRYLHHLLKDHGVEVYDSRTILPCSKCPSAFLRNTDRSKHDMCVHERLRPFRCNAKDCSSAFFFEKDLVKHRSTVHLRHKPFRCSICPKAFGKREHMTSHVKRVHHKLRPFRCDVCDIRLASKYNLQGHLKTAAHAACESLRRRSGQQQSQGQQTHGQNHQGFEQQQQSRQH